ncbi:amidohydrolase [Haloferax sp. AB510]|uniref:amidohydrolase family protein n=1 Tax=unclassified Haloferax TaxID=2625095 RepID=UPI0005B205F0|nr:MULTISPECIES: amidohydrolase family protein [unclassified Haloferax]MCO8265417.1 amidohydrolase [Haloferax sp. AB510]
MSQSTADSGRISSIDDLDVIVDTDFHLTERQEDIFPYLESPFDEMLNSQRSGDDYGYLGQVYPSSGMLYSVTMGKADSESVRTPEDVQKGKELIQWDKAIATPTQNLYLGAVHHDDLAAALANAYNSWLLDNIVDRDNGVYGAAIVAPQKPDKAAEEIDRRADEKGIAAVMIPSGSVDPTLGNEIYDPIYDACERAGLPLKMHNAAGTMMTRFPSTWKSMNRALPVHATAHNMMHQTNLADMLTQGVPERYPDLEFIIQESGLGWYPYFMRRIDHDYMGAKWDAPMLDKMPSEYLRDQFYLTSQPVEGADDPNYLNQVTRLFEGENNLMFSSDYPHFDFDNTDALLKILRSEFTSEEIQNIYGKTAERVYAFD